MSDSGNDPFGNSNPFQGMPIFGDLAKMLGSQGNLGWDAARQFALNIATGGEAEGNVDPMARIQIEQLARVAELQIANATGLDPSPSGHGLTIVPVTRAAWADQTLQAYRPMFEILAASLQAPEPTNEPGAGNFGEPDAGDPMGFMAPLMKMIGPMMLGLTAGSMVGHLATRSFGQYDLPIPRPASDQLTLLIANVDQFGTEWSLTPDDLRLWVCLNEVAHHAVFGVPHVRARLEAMLHEYLAGFEPDPGRLENELGNFENMDMSGPDAFQNMMSNPEVMLGAIRSPAQEALLPQIQTLVSVIEGYIDVIMDEVGTGLLSSYSMVTEAVRRRRVESAASDRFVEQLFGLELTQSAYDRGATFVRGVIERGGKQGLSRLWHSERELPTAAEVDAPGLWLARIDLPES